MSSTGDDDPELAMGERWAAVHTLLAECFKEPSATFVEEVQAGALGDELSDHAMALDLELSEPTPPHPDDRGSVQDAYLSLFEAKRQPYAPPAESPYKEWHGDREGGLLGGPSARDMERRYEALEATPPEGYPVDHVALLLEYGALLLEAGSIDAYRDFLGDHLDWIPAFRAQVEAAAAEAPFYRWAVTTLDEVLTELRSRVGVLEPTPETGADMVGRLDTTGDVEDRDRGFHPPPG